MAKVRIRVKQKSAIPAIKNKVGVNKFQSIILPIISVFLSAFAVIVSIYTYYDNRTLNENIRYKDEIIQRITDSRMLSFDTNIEFWDYSIEEIVQDMIDSNGLTNELSDVYLSVVDKQTGAALQILHDNEETLYSDEKYNLLMACLYVRDYILDGEYKLGYFSGGDLADKYAWTEKNNIDEEKYYIVQGIIAYYMDDFADSVQYLRMALSDYSKDSTFYNVANYWLAILSVRLRSNICDVDAFLNSVYNDNAMLGVIKSSISFLFYDETHDSHKYMPTIIAIYNKNMECIGTYTLPFMMNNPSLYLDSENSGYIANSGQWGSQEKLYSLYDMLFRYTEHLQQIRVIRPSEFAGEKYKEFFEDLNGCASEEVFFIDPRLSEEDFIESFLDWSWTYLPYIQNNGIDIYVPIDCIFDRLVEMAEIHSTPDIDCSIYAYSKAFEYCQSAYSNCPDLRYAKGCYAALALKYSAYNASDIEFDEHAAAECAYEFGYRYGYIFDSLINYYENEDGSTNAYKAALLRTEREKLHV